MPLIGARNPKKSTEELEADSDDAVEKVQSKGKRTKKANVSFESDPLEETGDYAAETPKQGKGSSKKRAAANDISDDGAAMKKSKKGKPKSKKAAADESEKVPKLLRERNANKDKKSSSTASNEASDDESESEIDSEEEDEADKTFNPNKGIRIGQKKKRRKAVAKPSKQYKVEAILGHRKTKDKKMLYYKIRWEGYESSDDTWEPFYRLSCPKLMAEYNAKKRITITKKLQSKKKQYHARIAKQSRKKKRKPRKSQLSDDESNEESFEADDKEEEKPADDESEEESEDEDYEVQKIIKVRKKNKTREFLVRWKRYGSDKDTWEPEANLNCPDLIEKFFAENDKDANNAESEN